MHDLMGTLAVCGAAIGLYVFLQWLGSLVLRDVSIVDRFWGGGFVLVAFAALSYNRSIDTHDVLLLCLVSIWGLRLSAYLTWRNWGGGEDYRYIAIRKKFGPGFAWSSLIIIFGFQGFLTWFISLPIQASFASGAKAIHWVDVLGSLLWAVGFAFEAVGDWQLARFKRGSSSGNQVLDTGLWRYTRHPNYFGDALIWWGIFLVALPSWPYLLLAVCPFTMTFLLVRVSGVTLLEQKLRHSRPGYEAYVARTSAFVPLPPKRMDGVNSDS